MMTTDDNKVVKLHQPRGRKARGAVVVSDDVAITPKSFLTMSEVEQDVFLRQLRERRLRAAVLLKAAVDAQQQVSGAQAADRLERKTAAVEKQLDRVIKAMDKLDEMIVSMRALTLQYTDTDITRS